MLDQQRWLRAMMRDAVIYDSLVNGYKQMIIVAGEWSKRLAGNCEE